MFRFVSYSCLVIVICYIFFPCFPPGVVQRKIGLKILELGGNAVIGRVQGLFSTRASIPKNMSYTMSGFPTGKKIIQLFSQKS